MTVMDFPLCEQVVTVYRSTPDGVLRQVLEDCFYRFEDGLQGDVPYKVRRFLLVYGGGFGVQPGDRVLAGIGPEQVDWQLFVPANVEGLSQAEYVRHYPSHIEAGCR